MKITTPTATLGIPAPPAWSKCRTALPPPIRTMSRSSSIPMPTAGSADRGQRSRRRAARFLTQGASGFTIRPGAAARASPPCRWPSRSSDARDQGFVRQVHSTQTFGRQVVSQQRAFRRANPGNVNPNPPIRSSPASSGTTARPDRTGPDSSAGTTEPSRTAAAERSARETRSAATAGRTEPPGTTAAGSA